MSKIKASKKQMNQISNKLHTISMIGSSVILLEDLCNKTPDTDAAMDTLNELLEVATEDLLDMFEVEEDE